MIICLTGTPGTGKTTIAKRLAKDLNLKYIDGNKVIEKYKLSEGYDKTKKCLIIDARKFSNAILKETKNELVNYIVDSHLSHHLAKKHVKVCVVCKCELKKLQNRLKKRKYPKSKIRENLDAEIMEICYSESLENMHKIIIYNGNYDKTKKALKSELSI